MLLVVGVHPNSDIAKTAGLEIGPRGAIVLNRRMETSVPDIYAAGDCAETWHRLLQRFTYLPLGTRIGASRDRDAAIDVVAIKRVHQ